MPKTKFDYFQTDDDEVTFTLIDENTVKRLQKDGTITLPQKTLDATKDMRWNMKQLNSRLLQGIMNGDPIPKIAESFEDVIGKNEVSTTRAARTMCTEAENKGRQDSYDDLAEQGVVQKKVWIATPDAHTREAHLEADGQEVDVDEPFILINSDGSECEMMFPADPDGDDEQVWNCRCSMRTHIVGFRKADGSVSKVDYGRDKTTHADQMAEEKERREQIAEEKIEAKSKQIEIPEKVREHFDAFEDKYMTAKFEHTITCDPDGNILYQGGGKKGSVTTPIGVAYQSEGCHTLHNHPENVVFSPQDMKHIEQFGLKTSTIITPAGNEYTVLNLNPQRKSEDDLYFFYASNAAFKNIEDEIADGLKAFRIEIMSSDLSREEKAKAIQTWIKENNTSDKMIEWYSKNAEKYGFVFQEKKR